ncbi:MAG: hypothetical protein Q9177_002563, partial [Variospora cf. flavescens]
MPYPSNRLADTTFWPFHIMSNEHEKFPPKGLHGRLVQAIVPAFQSTRLLAKVFTSS